eukprot:5851046-Pyramimonas_sp.AAC.1
MGLERIGVGPDTIASLKNQDGRFLAISGLGRALAGPQDRQKDDSGWKTGPGERVGTSRDPG